MSEEIIIDGVQVEKCRYCECIYGGVTCNRPGLYEACRDNPNCDFKQLKRLQKTLKHTENGKKVKAEKLKRIEEIVTHCIQGGFTDEFVQEIFDICREYEDV